MHHLFKSKIILHFSYRVFVYFMILKIMIIFLRSRGDWDEECFL
jgi:hypothetical protein